MLAPAPPLPFAQHKAISSGPPLWFELQCREMELQLMGDLANILLALKRLGIVHRDTKPTNLLVFDDPADGWRLKLVDFDVARLVEEGATRHTNYAGTLPW